MTKSELEQIFNNFTRTSVKTDHDGVYLAGKWVHISPIEDTWDVYLRHVKNAEAGNLVDGMTPNKLSYIYKQIPEGVDVHKLDGEAWFHTQDLNWLKAWLWDNRKILGLHKRRPAPVNGFISK